MDHAFGHGRMILPAQASSARDARCDGVCAHDGVAVANIGGEADDSADDCLEARRNREIIIALRDAVLWRPPHVARRLCHRSGLSSPED